MGFLEKLFGQSPKPGKLQPVTDETFEQKILASELPAIVLFQSKSCPHCHVMSGLLNEIGPEYVGKLNLYRMLAEKNIQTAARFRIRGVPTIIFFRDGKPVDQVVGLLPLIPLKDKFDNVINLSY